MNKVILVGRLTRDPEVRYTPSGVAQARFTIAVDRPYARKENQTNQQTADFIPVTAWRDQAKTIGNYFSKGQKILVEGRLQLSNYTAQDGTKKTFTDVVLERFEFVESKRDGSSGFQSTPRAQDSNQNLIGAPQDFPDDGDDVPPEQIPF
ncbi:MAG: single-stranded DNA-binding protein [Selenomonadaceae bacterium]|nr:single-stranded DNA-binding protein [Selenomonadaceae bacterium]